MEKGFNDDELADIMNEIESLEKEFSSGAEGQHPENEAEQAIDAEQVGQAMAEQSRVDEDKPLEHKKSDLQQTIDSEVSEVLEELAESPEQQTVPVAQKSKPQQQEQQDNIRPLRSMSQKHANAKTKMNFHVEGDLQLEMGFWIAGQEVQLVVSEEEGLCIQLESGAKFSVPLLDHTKDSGQAA